VKNVLTTSLEASGAVRHDSFALGGADLAAQVGLARLAELALLALGGATPIISIEWHIPESFRHTKGQLRGHRA
jgi:hypothetical protein